jgi:TnpA family transposase
MTAIERTAYPRFTRAPTAQELREHYTPTEDELAFARRTARRIEQRHQLLVQLKTFQRLGYFLPLDALPSEVSAHIGACLRLPPDESVGYSEFRTLYRHQAAIRAYLRVISDSKQARHVATRAVFAAAHRMDHPADLINVALETLIKERFELPAFSTLDRLVRRVRTLVNRGIFSRVVAHLSSEDRERLDALLERGINPSRAPFPRTRPPWRRRPRAASQTPTSPTPPTTLTSTKRDLLDGPYGAAYSAFQRLKDPPLNPTVTHLHQRQDLLIWLEGVCAQHTLHAALRDVPYTKRTHFAAEARALDSDAMRDMTAPKRLTLLACLLARTQVAVRDQLVEMFLRRIGRMHRQGKEALEALRHVQRASTEHLLGVFTEVVRVVSDTTSHATDATDAAEAEVLHAQDAAETDATEGSSGSARASGAPGELDAPGQPLTSGTSGHPSSDATVVAAVERVLTGAPHGRQGMEVQDETDVQDVQDVQDVNAGDSAGDARLGQAVRAILEAAGGAQHLLARCETLATHNGNNYLPLLEPFYRSHRGALFRVVRLLEIRPTTQDHAVADALAFVLAHQDSRRDYLPLPATLDLRFASEQWRRTVRKRRPRHARHTGHIGHNQAKAGSPTGMPAAGDLTGDPSHQTTSGAATVEPADLLAHRRLLEICVFSYIAAELKTGDLYVVGSAEYADYREQLLPWQTCEPLVADYCREVGLAETASDFVQRLRTWLEETAVRVDHEYTPGGVLQIDAGGAVRLRRESAPPPRPEVLRLEALLAEGMPERTLLDALAHSDHWVQWTRHFGPLSGSEPKLERARERYILTVFAYGTNLGPNQLARHTRGRVTAHQISMAHQRHCSAEMLDRAAHDLRVAYAGLELPTFWGSGRVAIADGTKYEVPERSLLAERSIRYGGVGGIAYHHITDTYIALFSRFIACGMWEAIYILDVLLQRWHKRRIPGAPRAATGTTPEATPGVTSGVSVSHAVAPAAVVTQDVGLQDAWESLASPGNLGELGNLALLRDLTDLTDLAHIADLEGSERDEEPIETLHADTQGQSTPVFALAYLLGIQLMPRIRSWADLVFYRPRAEATYTHLESLFGPAINWGLIETHWQDLMRVVLSLQAGTILPSTLLRKLSNYSRKNRLYQAFRELGRVVRTVFLLRYISEPPFARQITENTNKLESFNAFTDFLSFGDEDRIMEKTPEDQDKRLKYLDLLANAVMLQTVADMADVLRELGQQGYLVEADTIAALSPYPTVHLKRFGDYVVDVDTPPKPLDPTLPPNVVRAGISGPAPLAPPAPPETPVIPVMSGARVGAKQQTEAD